MTYFEIIDICKDAIFKSEYGKKYIEKLFFCPPKAGRELYDIELFFTTIDNPAYEETKAFCLSINDMIGIAKTNPEFPFISIRRIALADQLEGMVMEYGK